ncbi:Isopenicillin N epimerase [bacterium HR20]|nr:Isopenicillin N epimerase [bacterium HR20]
MLEVQHDWQRRFEREPVAFVRQHLHHELRNAAAAMAAFMGARGEDLVFVENATTGVNAVIRSILPLLDPGDELLTTSHVYNAVRQTLRYAADIAGCTYVEVPVPFPIGSAAEVVEAVRRAITERTRFALFDHVTSPTGLVFPVEELVRMCKERGIMVMIDGAHAPGMLPLQLDELGADWYTGNFHKWLFAPKGCAFLWTAPRRQAMTHPVVISHGYQNGYLAEFDFTGTKDWSTYLSAPAGLAFYERLGGGDIYRYNRTLALDAQRVLARAVGVTPPAPQEMIAFLAAVPLPSTEATEAAASRLQQWLFDEHRIEVPIFAWDSRLILRTASQVYNEPWEYDHLANILERWIARAD